MKKSKINKKIESIPVKKIEKRIAELKAEIDGYKDYDLSHPRYQDAIKLRRNSIRELLRLLGREKEYDAKDYFGVFF